MGIGSAVSSIGVCFELLGYLDLIQKNDFFAHLAWMIQGKYFKRKTVIQCTPHRLHNMVGKTEVKHDCVILFTPEGTFTFEGLSKRSTGFSDFWKASPSNPVHVFFQRAASTTNSVKIFFIFFTILSAMERFPGFLPSEEHVTYQSVVRLTLLKSPEMAGVGVALLLRLCGDASRHSQHSAVRWSCGGGGARALSNKAWPLQPVTIPPSFSR